MFKSLSYPNFRLFFTGQLLSLCGAWMQITAQSWLVYRLTNDSLLLGLVSFVGQFPVFLLGFHAGILVDRKSHYRIVVCTQALAMIQACLLAALTMTGVIQVWHVMVLSLFLGVISAFDIPARQVLIGELVEVEDRHNAIALNSFLVQLTRIMGPALAGILIHWKGEGICFAVNAVSFLSILIALSRMQGVRQVQTESSGSVWEEIGNGVSYALGREPIRILLGLLTIFSVAGLPIYVLLPVLARDVLHTGAGGMGVLSSISGAGATLGAMVLARRGSSRGLGGMIAWGVTLFGLGLGVLAVSSDFRLSAACLFVLGYAAIQVLAGVNTLLQELAGDRYRGRVMSFYSMLFLGISPVGSFLVGAMASRVGPKWTVATEALICVVAGLFHFKRLPVALSKPGSRDLEAALQGTI